MRANALDATPEALPPDKVKRLREMLNELESNQLRVELAPLNPKLRGYNEGGMKRVVTEYPPKWYRIFCGRHASARGVRRGKFDTKIKRKNVIRSLIQLISGVPAGKYGDELYRISKST